MTFRVVAHRIETARVMVDESLKRRGLWRYSRLSHVNQWRSHLSMRD